MKILLVTGSFPPLACGVGDYCGRLAEALADQPGVDIGILTSRSAGRRRMVGKVDVLPEIESWSIGEAGHALAVIREQAPDIVHVQYPTQGYAGRLPNVIPLLSKIAGVAVVQTWHEPLSLRDLLQKKLVPSTIIVVREMFADLLSPLARMMLGRTVLHYVRGGAALPVAKLNPDEHGALRQRHLKGQRRLIVFFGFIYPHKGVEQVFDIANPALDHVVIAGKFACDDDYRTLLLQRAEGEWAGKVTFTGFLEPDDAASLLSVADAVVLPFRDGGGDWNSSIHGATTNGAYVITTSKVNRGYDPTRNVAYSPVDDIAEMRSALALSGERRATPSKVDSSEWIEAASRHVQIYRQVLASSARS